MGEKSAEKGNKAEKLRFFRLTRAVWEKSMERGLFLRGLTSNIASLPPVYRSLEALWAENREKVSKKSSWAFRPRVSKESRKGRKVPAKFPKSVISGTFRPFRDFFFETSSRKAQEDFFETFLRFSARRASRLL